MDNTYLVSNSDLVLGLLGWSSLTIAAFLFCQRAIEKKHFTINFKYFAASYVAFQHIFTSILFWGLNIFIFRILARSWLLDFYSPEKIDWSIEQYWLVPLFFSAMAQSTLLIIFIHSKRLPNNKRNDAVWGINRGNPEFIKRHPRAFSLAMILTAWVVALSILIFNVI